MSVTTPIATARATLHRRPVRYAMVSVVSVAVSQTVLLVATGVLHWSAVVANLVAVSVGAVPSYALNRAWVWGKRGRNHLWREVVPFWALALFGLAFSTLVVALADDVWDEVWVPNVANIFAFGTLWVFKYLMLDSLLFNIAPADVIAEAEAEGEVPVTHLPHHHHHRP
jgi:putative flippase GtrA